MAATMRAASAATGRVRLATATTLLLFFSEGGDSYVSNSLVGNKFSVRLVCDAAAGGSSLVTGITLNKTATSIQVGSTETLSVTAVTPSDATDQTVTWSSSAESVATVTSAGVVTAVAAGTATITATANDGSKVSASCTVTVVPVGALSGKFSVSATKQVHFSKGNLQAKIGEIASYTATASEWRFAENQYRYIDSFAANDWVDLFSWVGTSATNDTYGLITFDSNSEEYHGNKTGDDGEILKTDWGTAAKANIGDNWYTLSKDEWSYLFNDRTGTCYCKAQVAGKSGVVLFPDNYSGTAPASPNTVNAAYTTNSWSAADWSSMETAGCVFLPAAGYRDGASVYNAGLDGGYWSSTPGEDDADYAYSLLFNGSNVNPASNDDYRYYGHSVRLVCDAPAGGDQAATVTDLSMVDCAGNARAEGKAWTANCYMVHKAGDYKLPLVYGNAIKDGALNDAAYTGIENTNATKTFPNHAGTAISAPWITKAATGEGVNKGMGITVSKAELLWQDAEGLVTKVGIDGDYLTLTVGKDATAQEGNAVIAAKASDGTIVWSWHIWVTKETFATLTTITTGTGTLGTDYQVYQVTPVNLGWVGDPVSQGTNTFYQWGRKDPFPGTGEVTPTESTTATIADNIKNPTTHYYNSSTYGPCNTTYYNMGCAEHRRNGQCSDCHEEDRL